MTQCASNTHPIKYKYITSDSSTNRNNKQLWRPEALLRGLSHLQILPKFVPQQILFSNIDLVCLSAQSGGICSLSIRQQEMNPHWPTLRLNHHSGFEYLTETTQHQTPSWMQCPHIGTSEALRWDWTNRSLNAIDATCVLLKPECVLVQYTLDMNIPPWTVHCCFKESSNAPRSSSHQGRNQTYSGANFQITYIHMAETSRRWNKLKWYTHELSESCPLQHKMFSESSLLSAASESVWFASLAWRGP